MSDKSFDILKEALESAADAMKKIEVPEDATASIILLLEEAGITPGDHVHSESNPLGLHSHAAGRPLDGSHIHTPQNPMGEHFHGPLAGMRLAHGAHLHIVGSMGPHFHPADIPPEIRIIRNPSGGETLVDGNPET